MSVDATRTIRGKPPVRSPAPASGPALRIAVVHGRDAGQFVSVPPSPGQTITIGSGRDCDLVLHDDEVSPRHLAVSWASEGVALRDVTGDRKSVV